MLNLFETSDISFFKAFARAVEDKEDAAFHITRICQTLKKRQLVTILSELLEDEIEATTSFQTLFRGNR